MAIEGHFKDFITAQGSFCKQMQMGSNRGTGLEAITANIETPISTLLGIQASLPIEEIYRLQKSLKTLPCYLNRFETISDQIGNRTTTLAETLGPLTKIYSEADIAEVRKRAKFNGVPELFVDWVMVEFMKSSPFKLPTGGDAYNYFGLGTNIGKKLNGGQSKQTLSRYLGTIRKSLEAKGLLATQPRGKGRKRALGCDPGDGRQEDINQPDPFEQAADRDHGDKTGLTTVNTLDGELENGHPGQVG